MITQLKKPIAAQTVTAGREAVNDTVRGVIADIRERGDVAVREYSEKFDNWSPDNFRLDAGRRSTSSSRRCPQQVIDDIVTVQANVRRFATRQRESITDFEIETMPGVHLGQKNIPISAAGAYIPGGRYPLTASAHMTIVTAKVAGVERVAACTPPIRGVIPAATIAAMSLAGADEIYVLGGVQAVVSLALGTETHRAGRSDRRPRQRLRGGGQDGSCSAKSASTCSPVPPRSW